MNDQLILICGKSSSGKAQPLTSTILTPTGFKTFKDIKLYDDILGDKGEIFKVTAIHEQGVKDNYRVTFNDGSSTECCDEHLWTYYRSRPKRKIKFPSTTKSLRDIMAMDKNSNIFFKVPENIDFPAIEHGIDPYTLGALLGDGGFTQSSITISAKNPEIIHKLQRLIKEPDYEIKKNKGDNHTWAYIYSKYTGSKYDGNKYLKWITDLNLRGKYSHDKFIPKEYLYDSFDNRLKLLQGIFDTDGSVSLSKKGKGSTLIICTTSPQFKEDIQWLIRSLGFVTKPASEDRRVDKYKSGVCYSINLKGGLNNSLPFTLSKHINRYTVPTKYKYAQLKLKSIEYIGKVQMRCITTSNPKHLYITDDFIVTHNSASLIGLKNPEGVMYLNCENNKKLPFKSKFKEFAISDPYQIYEAFTKAEEMDDVHTIVVDTLTYMMDMFESIHVISSANTMKSWGDYAQFMKNLMAQYVGKSTKNVIFLAHTMDILNESDMAMETLVKVKGSLMNQGIESFFSTVISCKKVDIKKLDKYKSELLTITPEEEAIGVKYVYQTKLTKETVNERMRSSLGLWDTNETFIDNNAQEVMDRLHDYYK